MFADKNVHTSANQGLQIRYPNEGDTVAANLEASCHSKTFLQIETPGQLSIPCLDAEVSCPNGNRDVQLHSSNTE